LEYEKYTESLKYKFEACGQSLSVKYIVAITAGVWEFKKAKNVSI
jgi:hypothetical protein